MHTFFRILSYARPLGWVIPQYLLVIIPATVFSVINLTVLIPLFQVLFDQEMATQVAMTSDPEFSIRYFKQLFYHQVLALIDTEGRLAALYFICGFIVCSVLLANMFRYLSQLILASVRVRIIRNLRSRAFESLVRFDLGFFLDQRKGDLISRITVDVQEVEQSAVNALKVMIKEPLLIIGYFTALLMISVELTLYTLILVPVAGLTVSLVARKVKKWAKRSQESLGRIGQVVDESISGMRVIKAFSALDYITRRFHLEVMRYASQTFRIAARSNLSAPISEVVGTLVLALLLVIGGRMVLSGAGEVGASQFIGFLIIFSQLLNPAKSLSVAFSQIQKGIASASRVFELVDRQLAPKSGELPVPLSWQTVKFEKVHFAYGREQVLKDLTFQLEKGKIIALVGPSGGGKSTIADLLCRFYDPSGGRVTLDGTPLDQFSTYSWREQLAVVSQEPILFHDSVFNNIAFGQPDIPREAVEKAARMANAHEFITHLENGYDTNLGEGGNKLSGGQKQRITIARAILKNPALLILDEATAALDAHAAHEVEEAIANLMKNRTTLLIAHRLKTVQHADEILVIDQGRMVQRGTHAELLKEHGLYQQLTDLQAF